MLEIILLVLAVSIDSFFVCIGYGIDKIKVPLKAIIIIVFSGTFFLTLSVLLSQSISKIIPINFTAYLSAFIFIIIGIITLFQNKIKLFLNKDKKLKFKIKEINFVIEVYLDESKADIDKSKELSIYEAIYLACALSIDCILSGLALGMIDININELIIINIIIGISLILLGLNIGKHLSLKLNKDYSYLSGFILILIGLSRFI